MNRNLRRLLLNIVLAYVILTRLVTPSYLAYAFRGPVSDLENEYTCNWNLVSPEDVTEENLQFLIDTGVCQKVGDIAEQPLLPAGDDDDDDKPDRPGHGYGDPNHDHTGPPGQDKDKDKDNKGLGNGPEAGDDPGGKGQDSDNPGNGKGPKK